LFQTGKTPQEFGVDFLDAGLADIEIFQAGQLCEAGQAGLGDIGAIEVQGDQFGEKRGDKGNARIGNSGFRHAEMFQFVEVF